MRRRPMVVAPRRMGRPGLMGTMARTAVVAGTATAVAGGVSRRGAQRADQQAQEAQQAQDAQQAQQPTAAAPAPSPGQDETLARLRELGDMKSEGLLTDDEFAAQKARILGSS